MQAAPVTDKARPKSDKAHAAKPSPLEQQPDNHALDSFATHRGLGNQGLQTVIQAKLNVGAAGDQYEKEADRVADDIVKTGAPPLDDSTKPEPGASPIQTCKTCGSTITAKAAAGVSAKTACPGCQKAAVSSAAKNISPVTRIERAGHSATRQPKARRKKHSQHEISSAELSQLDYAYGPAQENRLETAIRQATHQGMPLARPVRHAMEQHFGRSFEQVRIHTSSMAASTARSLNARAFTLGNHLVFDAGQYQPHSQGGFHLLAHELTHVVQQGGDVANDAEAGLAQRAPNCSAIAAQPAVPEPAEEQAPPVEDTEAAEIAPLPGQGIPDDENTDPHIDWPRACELNWEWWGKLQLALAPPMRSRNPESHPRAWANKTLAAQQLMFDNDMRRIEGAALRRDGILGPRTFIALYQVASQQDHPARSAIQGLGFDLDTVLNQRGILLRARALIIRPEFLLQNPVQPMGEAVVRYYDSHFGMAFTDREILDQLFFGGEAPENIRRADRIELLRRFYAQESSQLEGTLAWVRADRDFIHHEIDLHRAVDRDVRRRIDRRHWFNFVAQSEEEIAELNSMFDVGAVLQAAADRLPADERREIQQLTQDLASGAREVGENETFAILVAVYVPELDPAERDAIVAIYLAEKAERERQERERIEEHNLGVAQAHASAFIGLFEDEDISRLVKEVNIESQLRTHLRDIQYFHLVLAELERRGYFNRLFEEVEAMHSQRALGYLMELALAGPYADNARVQQTLGLINARHGNAQSHGYTLEGGGAVFLGGDTDDRLEVGQVAGDVNSFYLKDESKERLKPDAQEKFDQEIENQSRLYMQQLLAGEETERTQEQIGMELISRAWTAAGLDEDRDIEDVEIMESLRLRGLRRNVGTDGVVRYDAEYERVKRIVTEDSGIDTGWQTVENTRDWRSEGEFENQLFWYHYSQTADIVQTAAIVVTVAAVVIVAWEVGAIALLVEAGGGGAVVSISIALSVGFYMLTHQRWTLEGLLLAGLEGYLGAVGFKLFAPVGIAAASRFVLPATLANVSMRRALAAWLLRHGVQGALTGAAVGPAMVLAHDLIRVGTGEGGFSSLGSYLRAAGWGMLLGAVFEIGGSAILAPIFRAADATVLRSLAEVVGRLRGARELTPSIWMAEASGALANVRAWLRVNWDDAIANGLFEEFKDRLRQAGAAYLRGARLTLHRQVLELTETRLSQQAVDGLERVIGSGLVPDNTLINILRQVNMNPEQVVPWLQFLNGLDDAAFARIIEQGQFRALSQSPEAMALAMRRSAGEVSGLLTQHFGDVVGDLEQFATRVNTLDDEVSESLLEALRTRGNAVTPNSLLRMVDAGAGLGDEMLEGLERLIANADATHVEGLLAALPDDQVAMYLNRMRGAADPELAMVGNMLRDFGPQSVAWSSTLPTADAHTLLSGLSDDARNAIMDIPVNEAQQLVGLVTLPVLNDALTHGAAHGLQGSDLQRLRQHFHDASITDWLTWGSASAARMGRIARFANSLEAAATRLTDAGQVVADTIILDSNGLFAIEQLLRPTATGGVEAFANLTPNRQAAINAIRAQRGLTPYVDPPAGTAPDLDHIVGPNADLRSPPGVTTEAVVGEAHMGVSPVLDDLGGLSSARGHGDYAAVIHELEGAPAIGGSKGAIDRSIIADALLADTDAGVTPTLVSTDRDIVQRLALRYAVAPAPFPAPPAGVNVWNELVTTYGGGQFTIDILGHRLTVVFN